MNRRTVVAIALSLATGTSVMMAAMPPAAASTGKASKIKVFAGVGEDEDTASRFAESKMIAYTFHKDRKCIAMEDEFVRQEGTSFIVRIQYRCMGTTDGDRGEKFEFAGSDKASPIFAKNIARDKMEKSTAKGLTCEKFGTGYARDRSKKKITATIYAFCKKNPATGSKHRIKPLSNS